MIRPMGWGMLQMASGHDSWMMRPREGNARCWLFTGWAPLVGKARVRAFEMRELRGGDWAPRQHPSVHLREPGSGDFSEFGHPSMLTHPVQPAQGPGVQRSLRIMTLRLSESSCPPAGTSTRIPGAACGKDIALSQQRTDFTVEGHKRPQHLETGRAAIPEPQDSCCAFRHLPRSSKIIRRRMEAITTFPPIQARTRRVVRTHGGRA